MNIIEVENVSFDYISRDEDGKEISRSPVLKDISLSVPEGQFLAILGHNGCGKSTLAKHFNAILTPTAGKVTVAGIDTSDEERLFDIRQTVGMVFQNPDNQLVATVVEEDVAPAVWRTEAARCHRRSHRHAAEVHSHGRAYRNA